MKVDLYDATGAKKGQVTANDALFNANINEGLMHRAVLMRLSNARNPIAHVKTRGEVAYSTKKMFKQKGTGNARRGARSTNLLRGGGVTHGPRNTRNFTRAMPKKERRAALASALSVKANDKSIYALDGFDVKEPKTKTFVSLQSKLPEGVKLLLVVDKGQDLLRKSARNVPGVKIIRPEYLNVYDILWADKVCFLKSALDVAQSTFSSDKK